MLQRSDAHGSQIGDVRQMAWLHLKLLAARAAFAEVVEVADRERKKLDEQERRCRERLAAQDTDEELRRSLEQQIEVIKSRYAAMPTPSAAWNWWTPSSGACASRYRWFANRRCSSRRKATWPSRWTPCPRR